MQDLIYTIFHQQLSEEIRSFSPIQGLGSVNAVYEVIGKNGSYILRLNEPDKRVEYLKETWCIERIAALGIPSPEVLSQGILNNQVFMIQGKVPGISGKKCNAETKSKIWRALGSYAAQFHSINQIEDAEIARDLFHRDWKARLMYNLGELKKEDSLLTRGFFSLEQYSRIEAALTNLTSKTFQTGLIHGDLCPRNVLVDGETIHLLDWGTAEFNVVPHTELGILLISQEASQADFQLFLDGMGISPTTYQQIEQEMNLLNFLHRLDKYRWAEAYAQDDLPAFADKIRWTFERLD